MRKNFFIFTIIIVFCISCDKGSSNSASNSVDISFRFDSAQSGWQAGFADYPPGSEEFYQLSSEFQQLPPPLENTTGFRISGNNHSDDLFMFVKKRITGLEPNTRYNVKFEITFATNAPSGCSGVGGTPGESVYIKSGATAVEPLPIDDGSGFYHMNIDKGNQAVGGSDAITIGDFSNSKRCEDGDFSYELKTLDSGAATFTLLTSDTGEAWILFGTDSGYEATTTIYYISGKVHATKL